MCYAYNKLIIKNSLCNGTIADGIKKYNDEIKTIRSL